MACWCKSLDLDQVNHQSKIENWEGCIFHDAHTIIAHGCAMCRNEIEMK